MITLRRYFQSVDAHLAKSFLRDKGILADLLDDNSSGLNLFAIPIRLVVPTQVKAEAEALLKLLESETAIIEWPEDFEEMPPE
ncbi:MAG: putative signal transducing protein [Verrucomicrobiales bacterium]